MQQVFVLQGTNVMREKKKVLLLNPTSVLSKKLPDYQRFRLEVFNLEVFFHINKLLLYIYIYICICIYIYIKMNKSAKEFECGTLGFISYNHASHVFQTL